MFNFQLNNQITYRDQRLKGVKLIRGLVSFYVISTVGAVANIMLATNVYEGHSGLVGIAYLASIAGIIVGSVWNYAVSSVFTWKRR